MNPDNQNETGLYRTWGKRLLDLALLAALTPVVLPLVLIVAVVVRLTLGTPVLFRQKRPGYKEVPFCVVKFRTMTCDTDKAGALLPDDKRLTKTGRILRQFSLDELPQLWNVLKGEMSFVGPRPLLMQYLRRYTPEQARRQDARPGITGWAQVNGRNSVSWGEKLSLDVWYVDHCSAALDLQVLAMTFAKILRRDGISHGGHATMPEFKGGEQ